MSRALNIMTPDPATLTEDATVRDAVQMLQALEIRHLPVTNAQREVVGMVSDRDLRALAVPRVVSDDWLGEFRVALETEVGQIMSSDVVAVEEETPTAEIIDLMLEHKVGAVPVVDADGVLVGIVSYMDVLRGLKSLEDDES
jgi:CBS-domain-containing membrane protein